MNNTTLIEFPCVFPVKIIGVNSPSFFDEIKSITIRHFSDFKDTDIKQTHSQKNNFLSITATVYVTSQEALDAYYQDLVKHPDIKMVL